MSNDTDRDTTRLSEREDAPRLVKKLEQGREKYQRRRLPYRIAWTVAGFVVTLAGLIMIVTPGPALVLIPAGLVMLSFEFRWARRALDYALARGLDTGDYVRRMDPRVRRAVIIGGGVIVAIVIAAIVWYWFFLRH